jgi:import inner membrane translocase subunit TIM10
MTFVSKFSNFRARSCHNKCVSPRYAEPDLNKGESVCIDRCVAKFFEVNKKVRRCLSALDVVINGWQVGEKLQSVGNAAGGGGAFGMQS